MKQQVYKLLNNIELLYDTSVAQGINYEGKDEYQIVMEIMAVIKRTSRMEKKPTLKVVK